MNAKELILKKINADTNWVDIYTSAFVLGEDLNTIGSFMISPEISELISKYSSSLFDPDASFETKIQFIEKNISEADTPAKKYAYTELLERVKIAEELRILGKILKINQGMPTNTADFYEYVSKIEYYIESRLNKQLIDKYNDVRNLTSAEWIDRKKYYDTTVFPYKNAFKLLEAAIKKYKYLHGVYDLLKKDKSNVSPKLKEAITIFEDTMKSLGYIGTNYWKDYKIIQEAYNEWYKDLKLVIDELRKNWKKFSIIRFVKDEEYAQNTITEYESVKVKFNILDTLKALPHFNEMYKVLALNDRILTILSKRNAIESEVWQRAIHKYENGDADILMSSIKKPERKILKSLVDDTLIQTWLTTGLTDFYLSSPDGTRLDFDGSLSSSKLKSFIETSIIPRLRNNKFIINGQNIDTKSNEFVRRLTFGKHNGESIFKLPFNMSEIDSNPGIKQEYEKILQAFGELRNIHLEGGLTVVDVFYLYNLVVHKDHFGRNSLTRLFEDLISSKDGEKLLVFKFNEWLETVNEQEIVGKVLSSWGASHHNDIQYQNTLSNNLITTSKSVETTSKLTPKTRTVKYTPKGQTEQTYTIVGTKIFNKDGDEVYTDENSGHRKLIFVELALQEKRAVKVEYRNVTYIVNDRNQIFSTSSNKIVYQNENDGNRRIILERAKEEFAKLQNILTSIDINTISDKTEAYGVVFPKQGKTSQALKSEYQQWQIDNPTGIVAYRVKFPYNTIEEVQLGHIGNPFSENARGANTVQQFYDWLVTGNNFGNEKATDEYRRAIISKLLSTPANSPILYYTELNRPSHATVLGYLIANKQLLSNQSSPNSVQFDDSIDISEQSIEEPVTIGFNNKVSNEVEETPTDETLHINSDYIAEREHILANAPRNSEGKLLAPNGKVSKLTEEQWVTVRTNAFKEWFGDWINPYNENINISLDIDMESADTDGFGSRVAIILKDKNNPLQGEFIGSIPMQQQIKSIKDFEFTKYIDINSVAGSSYIEEEFRGKGFGKAAYWELGMWLSKNGSILRSAKDSSRTEAATRVWESLEKDGFAKKIEDRYEFVNNSSKVIDENSEPLVVYHHTDNSNLTEFNTDFPNYFSKFKNGTKKAIFFDENLSGTLSRKYDIPVFLNIKNLTTYVGTKEDLHKKGTDYTTVVNESAARDARFGGLHMSKFDDNKLLNQDVWIIHDEHNVKSATGAHEFTLSPNIYDADPTPVYQTTPSKQSKLIELVRQANEKGVKGIHIVSQSDLVNEDIYVRSAKGFVRNGEIYINVDRAGDDTVIHEFGHLYLADAKVNNREKYYELLEKVRQTKLWSDMKTWKAYANKIGSDFDEEVLATMIGDYYKSEFGTDYEYTDLVKEALSLVDGGFIDLINSEILPDLGDTFITNYALSQRTATLKHKLVSDNILKENCL